jgi:hypothetical protein
MDFFEWNYVGGFIGLSVLISVAISLALVRVAAMAHCIIVFYVCLELLTAPIARALGLRTPFRMSSVEKGQPVKSGCLVIAEDVVAVDAGQGTELRRLLHARYDASAPMKSLFNRLDILWGATGLLIVAVVVALIWSIPGKTGESVGFVIGK